MRALLISLATLAAVGAAGQASAQVVRKGSGASAADIRAAVEAFRADLGTLNANVAGSRRSGRREINWDGVPDAFSAPNPMPPNFFNVNSPRGTVFSTPGVGFQLSARAVSGTPVRFGNISSAFPTQFAAFSEERLFTAAGSVHTEVNFFVPGTATPATTRGFGVVFTDVDVLGSARIELFNGPKSLGVYKAPAFAGDAGMSFIGVSFADAEITRVRITSGSAVLGANVKEILPKTDLVVMDDFIYGEPGCYADCNGNGALTVADFACFQTRFVQGDAYTDCNGDGRRTMADFWCYQTRFVTGCP